jgi:NAD(P)-dependent dehydrogenase (short-subunit alcohol dehydrogenase family)
MNLSPAEKAAMNGKVVVMTGGTSGIGRAAATALAGMGARLVLVARDARRGTATIEELRQAGPGAAHSIHYADLSRVAEMKRAATAIAAAEPRIDVLINNAGAIHYERHVTEDGFELTFATNHLAYFVLSQALRGPLQAAAPSRVISTASDAHRGVTLDFADLHAAQNYKGFPVYSRSKLANILFTRELARQLAGTGITANCLHPGIVATRFGDVGKGAIPTAFRLIKRLIGITPEQGAETIVYLAASREVAGITGKYFHRCRLRTPNNEAQNDNTARQLWLESARLTGM